MKEKLVMAIFEYMFDYLLPEWGEGIGSISDESLLNEYYKLLERRRVFEMSEWVSRGCPFESTCSKRCWRCDFDGKLEYAWKVYRFWEEFDKKRENS